MDGTARAVMDVRRSAARDGADAEPGQWEGFVIEGLAGAP
jgi:hypothetical protein